MLLKADAGAVTLVAIPEGATHLRLVAQNTATVGVHFHSHTTSTVDLSWAAGSHRVAVPTGIFAALVQRVDAGSGDVSLVRELAARAGRLTVGPALRSGRTGSGSGRPVPGRRGRCRR